MPRRARRGARNLIDRVPGVNDTQRVRKTTPATRQSALRACVPRPSIGTTQLRCAAEATAIVTVPSRTLQPRVEAAVPVRRTGWPKAAGRRNTDGVQSQAASTVRVSYSVATLIDEAHSQSGTAARSAWRAGDPRARSLLADGDGNKVASPPDARGSPAELNSCRSASSDAIVCSTKAKP